LIIAQFLLISSVISCFAQLNWEKMDTAYGLLPPSIHIFKTSDSLDGKPFVSYYVSIKLKDKNLSFTAQTGKDKRYTPSEYYQQENRPLLIVNCAFFSYETDQNLSMIMKDGKLIAYNIVSLKGIGKDSVNYYYYPTRSAIGINRRRKASVAWIFTDSMHNQPYAFEKSPVIAKGKQKNPSIYNLGQVDWKWWKMQTAVGGGPSLIHDGKIWISSKEEQMLVGQEKDRHPRTAMGFTRKGRLIILVIQGRLPGIAEGASLEQEAAILKDIGCYRALNLDGGGSSCMLINGKETIKPSDTEGQRPVAAVFMVK
jgi:Phosphodiester glycosidase